MRTWVIRKLSSTKSDLACQRLMLMEAAYWRSAKNRPPLDEALADPELAKLIASWGRDGDAGYIAEDENGKNLGAAWYRFWTDEDHSYGYVAKNTPELSIGVATESRGHGIGASLLETLLSYASKSGIQQVSLSVEKDNPAIHLYERQGFSTVGEVGNAWTMVADTVGYVGP